MLTSAHAAATAPAGGTAEPEIRAMWVSRYEWPDPDPAKCKANIDYIMTKLAENHFNAVMFQLRGEADTLFPSPEEPWSPLMSPTGKDPGWDPAAYAVEAAHKHGLEFHAYINTHPCWQSNRHEPPAAKNHLFYKHGNAADPKAHDWLICGENGQPVQWGESNYVWMAPGVPDFQAYVRRQIMYIVKHYDVDGVHFDRIRTAGPQYSHDPISMSRQRTGSEGNPGNLDFGDWTRSQITRMLCDLYAEIAEAKPRVKVSCSPYGLYRQERYANYPPGFSYGYTKVYQDPQGWLAAGAMDFIVPMIYWADGGRKPDYSDVFPDWAAHAAGRFVCGGQSLNGDARELMHQVEVTRRYGGRGNAMFSFRGFDRPENWKAYTGPGGVYATPVRVPEMPWKSKPTDGIVLGTITDASGKPIVDARIQREGSDYTALTSGDGVYAFLKVPPGEYTLTIRKAGYDGGNFRVKVAAGKVGRWDVKLPLVSAVAMSTPKPPEQPASRPAVALATPPASVTAQPASAMPAATTQPVAAVETEEPTSRAASASSGLSQASPPAAAPRPPQPLQTPAKAEQGSRIWLYILVVLLVAGVSAGIVMIIFRSEKTNANV